MKSATRVAPVTIGLIVASVAVTALTYFGGDDSLRRLLQISDSDYAGWREVGNGQIWRLVTPMFLHFGIFHLLFNMMWMWDLGRLIEVRRGSGYYAVFVFALAAVSNALQYWISGLPQFGGMSGVVYGLLGYVWGQSMGRSDLGFKLNRNTVVMMLVWYVLCWIPSFAIANWAHTGGLAAGLAWGYLSAFARR